MNVGELRSTLMDEDGKLSETMRADLIRFIEEEFQREINREVIAHVMATLKTEDERA